MSRPPKFTEDDIVRAAELLAAHGEDVTPYRVKQQLGGGQVSRIGRVLEEWKQTHPTSGDTGNQVPEQVAASAHEAAEYVSGTIIAATQRIWTAALAAARTAVADETAELHQAIAALKREVDRAMVSEEALVDEINEARQAAAHADAERETARLEAAGSRAAAADARRALEVAEQHRDAEVKARHAVDQTLSAAARDAVIAQREVESMRQERAAAQVAAQDAEARYEREVEARQRTEEQLRHAWTLLDGHVEELLKRLPARSR